MTSVEEVRERLGVIRSRIDQLGTDVAVVAVTKTFATEVIDVVREAGIEDLGENYAQELVAKAERMPEPQPRWHFMGQLQRNKVSKIGPYVHLWQSIDSIALAESVARHVPGASVLLQVNLADEENRGGVTWSGLDALHQSAINAGLDVRGLMGVAPIADEGAVRATFRRLAEEVKQRHLHEVSMGMSNDYEIAVQEGSTMVRLGTALVGSRPNSG